MTQECYTRSYYEGLQNGSLHSAEVVAPLVLGLLPVRSVVDVGCGVGAWLAAFQKLGVDDIWGVDGEYVDANILQIPRPRFQAADLSKPFVLDRTFDLAMSLEVAEHLPPDCAAQFVESLTGLAPVVLFSAAIPFQGGNHHVNEQWPDYWAALFKARDYVTIDCIRKRVWENEAVEWWYAQNTLLFVRADALERLPTLQAEQARSDPAQLRLVHPGQFLYSADLHRYEMAYARNPGIRAASRILLNCLKGGIRKRLRPARNADIVPNIATANHQPKV